MSTQHTIEARPEVTRRVRAAGTSAAIGAVLLLYFGFARLLEPTPTDLFSWSGLILYHAVRWGGVLMAIVTVWLWTGHRPALLADGIVAAAVGVLLVVTGLGMGVGGGDLFQTIIHFFCGYLFYSSGVNNARDYFRLTEARTVAVEPARTAPPIGGAPRQPAPHDDAQEIAPEPSPAEDPLPHSPTPPSKGPAGLETPAPPPEGFLASFARDGRDDEARGSTPHAGRD